MNEWMNEWELEYTRWFGIRNSNIQWTQTIPIKAKIPYTTFPLSKNPKEKGINQAVIDIGSEYARVQLSQNNNFSIIYRIT